MLDKDRFTIAARLKSFVYAFQGIKIFLKSQHNAWIHLLIAMVVLIFGLLLNISFIEWCFVFLAMGIVLSAEGFNSAIELLCDIVNPDHEKRIGQVKDIAAGSVLISAIFAAIVGLVIFVPKLLHFINTGW